LNTAKEMCSAVRLSTGNYFHTNLHNVVRSVITVKHDITEV